MGDRGNAYLVDTNDAEHGIYLYTHWKGYIWPEEVRQALVAGRPRWGDPAYLNRMLISQLYRDIHDGSTGGGVSTFPTDNEYPVVIVDTEESVVAFSAMGDEKNRAKWVDCKTFQAYTNQERAEYPQE